jgi:hypothetical protein
MTDEDWEVVNEQIERSKITRIKWKKILGVSLTRAILELKKEGLNSQEVFHVLLHGSKLTEFVNTHFSAREKVIENLRISVSARFGESRTEEKILRGE